MKVLMICLLMIASFSFFGCAYTPISVPTMPDFNKASKQDCPVKTALNCPIIEQKTCPRLDMPQPIPKNMIIEIKDGTVVNIDKAGTDFIRQFVAIRKAVKTLWSE